MDDGLSPRPVIERLMANVQKHESGCWLWTGAQAGSGYGTIGTNDRTAAGNPRPAYVHRVSYEHFVGPIPDGLEIDHLCRVRNCVNPEHLEPVTHRENQLRGFSPCGANARKLECKHGHEFTERNTRTVNGKRYCRRCDARRAAESRSRRVAWL